MGRRSRARGRFDAPELVGNGDFSQGLKGWDISRAEIARVVDGWLEIRQTTQRYSYVQRYATVVPGRLYEFEAAVKLDPSGSTGVNVQIYDGNVDLIATIKTGMSGEIIRFRPVNNQVRIMARLNAAPGSGFFDRISLREA